MLKLEPFLGPLLQKEKDDEELQRQAEKTEPGQVIGRGATARQSLEAGFAVARCGVRQQEETSADHRRAAAGIHEEPGLSKLYL